jgi:small subunit ribosomal protein S20
VANIKSQIKRNRQNDKKRLRNRVYRGEARIAVRDARSDIDAGAPESKTALMQAISSLDKAAEQGVIHKNNAARRKSRLMKAFAKMVPVPVEAGSGVSEPLPEAGAEKISSTKSRKASPRKTAGRKVEEPKLEAAAISKDESKESSAKAKKAPAKKPVAKKAGTTSNKEKAAPKKKPTATK